MKKVIDVEQKTTACFSSIVRMLGLGCSGRRNSRGIATVGIVVGFVVFGALSAGVLRMSSTSESQAISSIAGKNAYNLAESGLRIAISRVTTLDQLMEEFGDGKTYEIGGGTVIVTADIIGGNHKLKSEATFANETRSIVRPVEATGGGGSGGGGGEDEEEADSGSDIIVVCGGAFQNVMDKFEDAEDIDIRIGGMHASESLSDYDIGYVNIFSGGEPTQSLAGFIYGINTTVRSGGHNDYKHGIFWYNDRSTINDVWERDNGLLSYDLQAKFAPYPQLKYAAVGLSFRARKGNEGDYIEEDEPEHIPATIRVSSTNNLQVGNNIYACYLSGYQAMGEAVVAGIDAATNTVTLSDESGTFGTSSSPTGGDDYLYSGKSGANCSGSFLASVIMGSYQAASTGGGGDSAYEPDSYLGVSYMKYSQDTLWYRQGRRLNHTTSGCPDREIQAGDIIIDQTIGTETLPHFATSSHTLASGQQIYACFWTGRQVFGEATVHSISGNTIYLSNPSGTFGTSSSSTTGDDWLYPSRTWNNLHNRWDCAGSRVGVVIIGSYNPGSPGGNVVNGTARVLGTPDVNSGNYANATADGEIRLANLNSHTTGAFSTNRELWVRTEHPAGNPVDCRFGTVHNHATYNFRAAVSNDFIPNEIKPRPENYYTDLFGGNPPGEFQVLNEAERAAYQMGPLLIVLWKREGNNWTWLAYKDISHDVYTRGCQFCAPPLGNCTSGCVANTGKIVDYDASLLVRVREMSSGFKNEINVFYGDDSQRYTSRSPNNIPYDILNDRARHQQSAVPGSPYPFWPPDDISNWSSAEDYLTHLQKGGGSQYWQWDAVNPDISSSDLVLLDDGTIQTNFLPTFNKQPGIKYEQFEIGVHMFGDPGGRANDTHIDSTDMAARFIQNLGGGSSGLILK